MKYRQAPEAAGDSEGCKTMTCKGRTEATGGQAWKGKILEMLQMT